MAKKDDNILERMRHSCAHLLAAAVQELWPEVKLGVGPVIEHGCYYDFDLDHRITEEDFPTIERKMAELKAQGLGYEREEVSIDEAKKRAKAMKQPYKVELIEQIEKTGSTAVDANSSTSGESVGHSRGDPVGATTITFYKTGNFVDLCRGGHVESTKEIGAFKILSVAGAYWRGDERNPMMQRLYVACFATQDELDTYLTQLEEAKKRDHRKLGQELDLFTFSDLVGPGLPLFTPRGTMLRNLLDSFVWHLRRAKGYQQVDIPHITKKALYETSGHWEKFKDDLFRITSRDSHEFAIKPMSCPHHTQIYARHPWSYRELPQRYAETTKVYRDEQTGELGGLTRVLSITQDDSHVFCRHSQIKEEFLKIWDIVDAFYSAFGFTLRTRLSFHDPNEPGKYLGTPEIWKNAEEALREISKERKADSFEAPGEAALYGPKLDFMAKDSLGREHQVATIQIDMNLPERFDLTCVNEEGQSERIVMIHAAIMGSIERFLAVYIEHTAGKFPLWLAPVQVKLLPIADRHVEYTQSVAKELESTGYRVELDDRQESIGKKIRTAQLEQVPYMLVVGDKEIEAKPHSADGSVGARQVAVRSRDGGDLGTESIADLLKRLAADPNPLTK